MSERPQVGAASGEPHDQVEETVDEGAKPSDVGALDGAAAAGSAGAVSTEGTHGTDGDGSIPTSAPDPSIGPD